MKSWGPIFLLNVDLKIISKEFASRLRTVLPSIMSSEQRAHIEKHFIGVGRSLISDTLSVTNNLKTKSYLVTMDIEKVFDSVDHSFLTSVLKKVVYGAKLIDWIKIFLYQQESRVLNGGFTKKYFNLEKSAHQSDPNSAYLFILALSKTIPL